MFTLKNTTQVQRWEMFSNSADDTAMAGTKSYSYYLAVAKQWVFSYSCFLRSTSRSKVNLLDTAAVVSKSFTLLTQVLGMLLTLVGHIESVWLL